MGRPKVQVIRPGDETIEVYIDGKQIAYVNHDEHGWSGMTAMYEAVKATATLLGADFEDTDEPDAQPYTYFIAYTSKVGNTQNIGTAWWTGTRAIESKADLDGIVAEIQAARPDLGTVVVTNFICTDGPC